MKIQELIQPEQRKAALAYATLIALYQMNITLLWDPE